MRKIGIFTAYHPHVQLGQEGIGRLMLYILKGMLDNGDDVTILAPSWHKKEVRNLLKEHRLEKSVHIHSVCWHEPILLLIYDLFYWFRMRSGKMKMKRWDWKAWGSKICFVALSTYSLFLFLLYVLGALLFAILFSPVILLIGILRKAANLRKSIIPQGLKKYFSFIPRSLRTDIWVLGILQEVRKFELKKMIAYVNASDIEYWYIPSIFWPEALNIKKRRALVVPDLVYADFPQLYYSDQTMVWCGAAIDRVLKTRPQLICYSHYVAERQLRELRDIRANHITVVPHGIVDLSEYLKMGLPPEEMIEGYLKNFGYTLPHADYFSGYNFKEGKYIIYTSQYRYHKNIKMLLNVFENLLRKKYCNLKLILTCANYELLEPLIRERNLEHEVMIMPHIPESVMAALNSLACLHVNPSLFEGAFPFTFGEAFSVGTPSVMADIPVTREIVKGDLIERMLFNPYDENDMISKICWGLEHRDELLKLEQPLFEHLSRRSWKEVAEEYVQAMRVSYERELPKRRKKLWTR